MRHARGHAQSTITFIFGRIIPTEAQSLMEIADTFTDQFAFQLLSALNLILGVARVQALLEVGGQAAQKFAANFVSREKEQPQASDSIR